MFKSTQDAGKPAGTGRRIQTLIVRPTRAGQEDYVSRVLDRARDAILMVVGGRRIATSRKVAHRPTPEEDIRVAGEREPG